MGLGLGLGLGFGFGGWVWVKVTFLLAWRERLMRGTTHSRPREVVESRNQWSHPVVGRAGQRSLSSAQVSASIIHPSPGK